MSTISAGTTNVNSFIVSTDTTGNLVLQTAGSNTALTLDSSQNATFTGYISAPNTFGFKNRIINGDMRIDQRNSGNSVTPTIDGSFTLDRWKLAIAQASKLSFQQNAASVTPPTGFVKYLGATSQSAYTVLTGDYFAVYQPIEGLNVCDLAWGTSSAATVTLSFWVRSSLTGTFSGSLYNSAGSTQSYVFNYTINSANTWQQVILTITGPTSGTWNTDNTQFVQVRFGLGTGTTYSTSTTGSWVTGNYVQSSGSTSVVGTSGATFYITGVQFEKGSQATPFDFRSIGTELALCQRYFVLTQSIPGGLNGSGATMITAQLPVTLRATPAVSYSGTITFVGFNVGTYTSTTQPSSIFWSGSNLVQFAVNGFGATGASGYGSLYNALVYFSAEL